MLGGKECPCDRDTWLWLLREANSRLVSKQKAKDANFSRFRVVQRICGLLARCGHALFLEVMAEKADQHCSTSLLPQCGQTTSPSS
jgi:hypothetical protein